MKLEQHLSDIEALGEDLSTFTQEELHTIFKQTLAEIDDVYLETLSYFVNRVKKQRSLIYTCGQLLCFLKEKAESIKSSKIKYRLVQNSIGHIILVPCGESYSIEEFTVALKGFKKDEQLYVSPDEHCLNYFPLDLKRIDFRVPTASMEMFIE